MDVHFYKTTTNLKKNIVNSYKFQIQFFVFLLLFFLLLLLFILLIFFFFVRIRHITHICVCSFLRICVYSCVRVWEKKGFFSYYFRPGIFVLFVDHVLMVNCQQIYPWKQTENKNNNKNINKLIISKKTYIQTFIHTM